MFNRSTESAVDKAAKRAKKRHAAAERRREKNLTKTFNTAAQLKEELTALEAAHPKFEFIEVEGAFLTNIPIKSGGYSREYKSGGCAGDYMEIDVCSGGMGNSMIYVTKDRYSRYEGVVTTTNVKKAAKVVAKHIGKRGLAS